jgi:lipopolysaccharide export system protein LptA
MIGVKNLTLLLLTLCSSQALALNTDSEQPIQISADAGTVNEVAGISTYSGNVAIDQGSMHIAADEVEVVIIDKRVVKIIARALPNSEKLARYEHLPENAEKPVVAEAKLITYLASEERLNLSGQARLEQIQGSFSGDLLLYDVNRGIVDIKSGDHEGDRIKMTISPQRQ